MPVISNSFDTVTDTNEKTVFATPCRVLLIHYRNADDVNRVVELKDGQDAEEPTMTLHMLHRSNGVLPLGDLPDPGILFAKELFVVADEDAGDVAIDFVLEVP
jgi:hypothetical protein